MSPLHGTILIIGASGNDFIVGDALGGTPIALSGGVASFDKSRGDRLGRGR